MTTSVLSALDIKSDDKLIVIKEQKLADSTFIISSIISNSFINENNICLVTLHNASNHYHNIGKRLGYDLSNQIKDGHAKIIEPLKTLYKDIILGNKNKETIIKELFLQIKTVSEVLSENTQQTTIIIDDISHLFDLGIDLKLIVTFLKCLIGLTLKNDMIYLVINCHVATEADEIVANILLHSANMAVTVSVLKTGRSRNISGVFTVRRSDMLHSSITRQNVYHYKLYDKEIRTFAPGRALM